MTDPTAANIFRVFGTIEPGQCTLVMDEAEKIDEDKDMMSILKSGYQYGKKVQRINQFGKQDHYHTFGIKVMLAERTPSLSKAKGVMERTFSISNFKGKPQLEIKEIKNPQNKTQKGIATDLEFLRKTLIVYRLVHFRDSNIDIDTGLEGRDKELSNPILSLFIESESQRRMEIVFETLLGEKKSKKANSLEREVLEVVEQLFIDNPNGKVPFANIWNNLAEKIGGSVNYLYRPNEMETDLYGTVYKGSLSKMLRDRFGASDPEKRNAKERFLQFNVEKIRQSLHDYRKDGAFSIQCRIANSDSSDSSDASTKDLFNSFFKISLEEGDVTNNIVYEDMKHTNAMTPKTSTHHKD
jgi:hypothetical protein